MGRIDFDIDDFLAEPLVARLATSRPAVRPVWFLWEEQTFWFLVGPWNRIPSEVEADPRLAVTIDTCDLASGDCRQVIAKGLGELVPYDRDRGFRKLQRYLGPDVAGWDERFQSYLSERPDARWLRLVPLDLVAKDLSFKASLDPRTQSS